ncbi:hypothetical protein Tco_0726568 [Tanacetum coccineum]|uniref:Reverse transcriptase domain-containing protein n=1 Tax=Tanacetum coccineum TaxID=301880 RepID=A0ABQ4YIB0_9ASTR
MADQRNMAELLRTPTEGYAEAIVVPPILAEHFELKHSLINMMTSDQFFRLEKENPHDHIHRYKDLLHACPHHGFTELHQLDILYNALNPTDQDSLNSAAGGNLLERSTRDVLTIIENKSKVRNSRNKLIVSQVKSSDVNSSSSSEIAKLTHAVNQQTSAVTTAMTAILKQFQATPPPASVKAVEEICVTCGGAHPYYQCLAADGNTFRDNIQGYVSAAAVNYNQGNSGYRPPSVANQIRPPGFAQPNVQNNQNRFSQPQGYNRGNNFNQDTSYQAPTQQNQVVPLSELEKIKKINEVNIKAMQAQINNVKNELRNEMQTSIQASMNMMASFFPNEHRFYLRHNKSGVATFRLANGYAGLRDALSSKSVRFLRDERQLVDSLWTTHYNEPSSLQEKVSWFFLVLTLNLLIILFLKQIWFSSACLQQPKPSPHCLALPYSPRWKRVKYSSLGPLVDLMKADSTVTLRTMPTSTIQGINEACFGQVGSC